MESYWSVLVNPQEKFRTFNFFCGFWIEIILKFNGGRPCLGFLGCVYLFSVKVPHVIAFSQSQDSN